MPKKDGSLNARERDWIMVRLRRTTRQRLQDLADVWQGAYTRGVAGVPAPDDSGRISLDTVVLALVVRNEAKMRRSASSGTKRDRKPGKDLRRPADRPDGQAAAREG